MKDNSTEIRSIGVNNIFSANRLGLSNTFEEGRSLTLGLDYRKEKLNSSEDEENEQLNDINNYFELKLATVIRDKEERFIPIKVHCIEKIQIFLGQLQIIYMKY